MGDGDDSVLARESGGEAVTLFVGIPTMNRPELLRRILNCFAQYAGPMNIVIAVSDDSNREDERLRTRRVCEDTGCVYLAGPRQGVCANRNNIIRNINKLPNSYVMFIDDDCRISEASISSIYDAIIRNSGFPNPTRTIIAGREISGVDRGIDGLYDMAFGGFYIKTDYVGVASCKAAVYPAAFFECALWNEDIYFGYEDADLAFQARRNGFSFIYARDIVIADEEAGVSTLNQQGINETERWIWAARIHVGLKRYVYYRPNAALAVLFGLYALAKLSLHAIRQRDIALIPDIMRRAKLNRLRSSPWRPERGLGSALAGRRL